MTTQNQPWQYLIDVAFNDKKEVPIEHIAEFRKLSKLHKIEDYCDYLRDKKLSETLLEEPWEWKYLEDLSKILPDGIQILVLKGAAARDMDLYPLPNLRKSIDLDIFVSGLNNKNEIKDFIEQLKNKNKIEFFTDWKKELKRLNGITIAFKDKPIDIHFELFSHLDLMFGLRRKDKKLEDEIVKRAVSYRELDNIKKLSYEDFFFHNLFEYLKEFPFSNLSLVLDLYLILKENKTTIQKLKEHAIKTRQSYLFKIGFYILNQLNKEMSVNEKTGWFEKYTYKVEKVQNPNLYGLRSLLTDRISKYLIITNGNPFLACILAILHLIKYNLIVTTFSDNPFTFQSISNLITKILYTYTKFKNYLKKLCLKAASTSPSLNSKPNIIQTEKKPITVQLSNLKITFNIPIEFYDDLKRIWEGFLSNEHLNYFINVEKISIGHKLEANLEIIYSNEWLYLKLPLGPFGNASLNSAGDFFANSFWDIRCFALGLFRAMTFESNDLLLVHAGGVKINNAGIIFPGESSTGKSTFFNLLTRFGANGINDDTILLKKENDIWYMCPTPFMSKKENPIICEKTKLEGIFDIVKVCGGHEIQPQDIEYNLAVLLNNSIGDFVFDDNGSTCLNVVEKILEIKNQIKYAAKIMFSLGSPLELNKLINGWLLNPSINYKYGNDLTKLIEIRGKSMEPTFKHGDILKVKEVFPSELKPQDIVGFKKDKTSLPIIHRVKYLIKHKDSTTIITKGDSCTFEDSPNIFKSKTKLLKILEKIV